MTNKFKYRTIDQMTQSDCKDYLKAIGYGGSKDYPKIYVNGLATNWTKNCKVAAIAYKAKYGVKPYTVEFADN